MAVRTDGRSQRRANAYVRPQTAQQAVLQELRKNVTTGELRPGAMIRQDEIAEQLGVSRVPVREALKLLEGEGLVTYTPHHGFRVTRLSFDELIEVYTMREWLETGLVRASVPLLGRQHLAVMEEAMELMTVAAAQSDLVTITEQNRRFHFQLFEPSGFMRAMRTVGQLWDTTDPYRSLYFDNHYTTDTVNVEHEKIVKAAFAHDVEKTIGLLNVHRGDAMTRLRRLSADAPPGEPVVSTEGASASSTRRSARPKSG